MCRDSSVGLATRYGQDNPGIESQWGARFSSSVHTVPGAQTAPYTMGTGSLLRVILSARGFEKPYPSSAEVKEKVKLYLYSTYGSS